MSTRPAPTYKRRSIPFSDEAAEIAADIGATNISSAPGRRYAADERALRRRRWRSSVPRREQPARDRILPDRVQPDGHRRPLLEPVAHRVFQQDLPCLKLPLPPAPSQPQQQHYFVVYHNINHINGGPAIRRHSTASPNWASTGNPAATALRSTATRIDVGARGGRLGRISASRSAGRARH